MPYITDEEYTQITLATPSANIDANIVKASRLLDQRMGQFTDGSTSLADDGWKIQHTDDGADTTFPNLVARQEQAVQEWVAWAAKHLETHGGTLGASGDIQLGRFRKKVDAGMDWKRHMAIHDATLVDAGMVRLAMGKEQAPNDSWVDYY